MTPLVAAATESNGDTGFLLLVAAGAAVYYVIHCVFWPFRACTKCRGAGRFWSGRAFRYCNKCNGRGAQLRIGRRLWTSLRRTQDRDRRTR